MLWKDKKKDKKNDQLIIVSAHNYGMIIDLYAIDLAIHGVVCQKYDVLDNSDIQNSQKLDPLEKTAKKFNAKIS